MGQKWIIDVIADLRAFADQNGLDLLAHQLDVTSAVAQAEIATMLEGAPRAANGNEPCAITMKSPISGTIGCPPTESSMDAAHIPPLGSDNMLNKITSGSIQL